MSVLVLNKANINLHKNNFFESGEANGSFSAFLIDFKYIDKRHISW